MKYLKLLLLSFLFMAATGAQAQAFINFTSANGLPDDNVMAVAVAYNNHAWFATSEGVARYNGFTWTTYDSNNGIADDYIKCIAITPIGEVWVGTDYGVSHFNQMTWTNYNSNNGLIDNMVNCIAVEQSGVVWIGTSNGVSKYSNGTFTNYGTSSGLPSTMISAIAIDSANVKWFCTWMGGVARYNDTTFTVFDTSDGLPDNNITSIAFDHSGNKYLGTYFGVAVLNAQNQWVRNITHNDGLLNDFVQAIAVDDSNRLYVGTFVDYLQEGAVTIFEGSQNYSYRAAQGLVSEYIEGLAIDKPGNLWIATGQGVSKFYTAQLGLSDTPAGRSELSLWPNPAASIIHPVLHTDSPADVFIHDSQGRLCLSSRINGGDAGIDVSRLSPGLYFLSIETEGGRQSSRFIRE